MAGQKTIPLSLSSILVVIYFCSGLPFGGLIQELLGKTLSSDRLSQFSIFIHISTGHYNCWMMATWPNGERTSPGASLTQKDGYGSASGGLRKEINHSFTSESLI